MSKLNYLCAVISILINLVNSKNIFINKRRLNLENIISMQIKGGNYIRICKNIIRPIEITLEGQTINFHIDYEDYITVNINNGKDKNIILIKFDSVNISLSYMFYEGSSILWIDLSNFDTSNVTDMRGMFYYCGL